jgi:hypothetical protein
VVAPQCCFAQHLGQQAQKVICGIPVKELPKINFFGLLVGPCNSPKKWKSVTTQGKKIRVDSQIRQVNSKSMEVSDDSRGKKNQSG